MFRLLGTLNLAFSALLSANMFAHVYLLEGLRKKKWAGVLVGLGFAGLSWLGTREILSTSGMALLTFHMVLIAFDFVQLILRIFGKGRGYALFKGLKRRGLAFFCALVYCIYGLINVHVIRETRYAFENDAAREEITIGLVSDSHLGTVIHAAALADKIEEMISAGADLVVLAGDIVDESTDRNEFLDFTWMMESVRAPKGIYFVFGNHDASHYGGVITRLDMEAAFARAGVTVLTDESVLLDGWLRIIGREAAGRDRKNPEALMEGADPENEFILMIDHQPAETRACAEKGVDLLVSGHTHNGQIFPVNVISRVFRINEIEYGHEKIGDMHAVVSSGVAGWRSAFRTAGKSECVFITVS